jgi:hypothetical protein
VTRAAKKVLLAENCQPLVPCPFSLFGDWALKDTILSIPVQIAKHFAQHPDDNNGTRKPRQAYLGRMFS